MKTSSNLDNKKIAKNTLFLYFRMIIIMVVNLYVSRIILNSLGIEDFGIYNIVGGVVVLFSFLNTAMSAATQRFLSYELGRNDLQETKRVFSMSLTSHISIVIAVFILAETIGLWFLNTQINLPEKRMEAANWVYQFSILATCIGIIQVPYNSAIIAYERMSFFAYIGIVEAVLKLLTAFLLTYILYDKLKVYSILVFIVTLLVFITYKLYCTKKIEVCKYYFFWDSVLYKKLMSFSGWSMLGGVANIGAGQGVNIILNIFYGVLVNAAMGIANQVNSAVNNFLFNFQIAFKPQIVKLYASQEIDKLEQLIYRASKISFILLFLLAFPIMINIDFILSIWLGKVPVYTAIFCVFILLNSLIESFSAPLWIAVQATGKIKKYQILISIAIMFNLLLSYIFLAKGYSPIVVFIIRICLSFVYLAIRLFYLKQILRLSIKYYFKKVIIPLVLTSLVAGGLTYISTFTLSGIKMFISSIIIFYISCAVLVNYWCLNSFERKKIIRILNNLVLRIKLKK